MKTDSDYERAIDAAIRDAEGLMDLTDIDDEDEEARERAYEERFHCGTCIVRTVLEQVWPAIDEYIEHLKEQK